MVNRRTNKRALPGRPTQTETHKRELMIFSTARMGPSTTRRDRFRIWIRPNILLGITVVAVSAILAAWIEFALVGSPLVPPVPPTTSPGRTGFRCFWKTPGA